MNNAVMVNVAVVSVDLEKVNVAVSEFDKELEVVVELLFKLHFHGNIFHRTIMNSWKTFLLQELKDSNVVSRQIRIV